MKLQDRELKKVTQTKMDGQALESHRTLHKDREKEKSFKMDQTTNNQRTPENYQDNLQYQPSKCAHQDQFLRCLKGRPALM